MPELQHVIWMETMAILMRPLGRSRQAPAMMTACNVCKRAGTCTPIGSAQTRAHRSRHVNYLNVSFPSAFQHEAASRSFGTSSSSSSWFGRLLRNLAISGRSSEHGHPRDQKDNSENAPKKQPCPNSPPRLIDTDTDGKKTEAANPKDRHASKAAVATKNLPPWSRHWSEEFGHATTNNNLAAVRRRQKLESTRRIVRIAADRVLEPSAVALVAASASLVVGLGAAEALLLIDPVHMTNATVDTGNAMYGPTDIASFVARYSLEQLLPSTVWSTQDGHLVAAAIGYGGGGDAAATAASLLRQLDPAVPSDASTLLALGFCETLRSMAAGFMLLAQLVRAGAIGAQAPSVYEERVRAGREPPILITSGSSSNGAIDRPGLIMRFCGKESNIISTSMRRMGHRIFPVFEEPFHKVSHLIAQHSHGHRIPVFWSVRPDRYGSSYSWEGFPVAQDCLVRTTTGKQVLVLEADATNANDPLALGDQALDLTLDDSSQGFRRIEELYSKRLGSNRFRTLKVYLGNALEVETSGGGHSYTLRHRVKFSKEVDVLIDSRAPILGEILKWCDRVTAGKKSVLSASGKKIILFQTSSRQYFLSLQLLLEDYGYELHDPLDWHVLSELTSDGDATQSDDNGIESKSRSLLGILNADDGQSPNAHTLQDISRLTRLPRLIYHGKTAETVNAVQALVDAGGVDAASCCALLDKEDGTRFLESNLDKDQIELVQRGDSHQPEIVESSDEEGATLSAKKKAPGLHIICSSAIYDDLFRQVRQWTRMGYSAKDIQVELDGRYQAILRKSKVVREAVAEATETEDKTKKRDDTGTPMESSAPNENNYFGEDIPGDEEVKGK